MENHYWLLLHENVQAQPSLLVEGFLAKNKVTTLESPPYSPHLLPADFYFFPQLKSALKGRSFCDATDIIKNATEELKMLSKMASRKVSNAFTVSGSSVRLHKGDYFEENVA